SRFLGCLPGAPPPFHAYPMDDFWRRGFESSSQVYRAEFMVSTIFLSGFPGIGTVAKAQRCWGPSDRMDGSTRTPILETPVSQLTCEATGVSKEPSAAWRAGMTERRGDVRSLGARLLKPAFALSIHRRRGASCRGSRESRR